MRSSLIRFATCVVIAIFILQLAVCESRCVGDETGFGRFRGSGGSLEVFLHGRVVDETARGAMPTRVICETRSRQGRAKYPAKVDGDRFEVWVPVNETPWHFMFIEAHFDDGGLTAATYMHPHQLRTRSRSEIVLQRLNPARLVTVRVLGDSDGQPIDGATVRCQYSDGREHQTQTDQTGAAVLPVPLGTSLQRLSGWTNDYQAGGYFLSQRPEIDSDAGSLSLRLHSCRRQKVRVIGQDGHPVTKLNIQLRIVSDGPPSLWLDSSPESELRTDSNGELHYPWFPDLDDARGWVSLESPDWKLDHAPKFVDEVLIATVTRHPTYQRVRGRVTIEEGDPEGLSVRFESWREHQTLHQGSTFADVDGWFWADLIPDATYGFLVNDSRFYSGPSILEPGGRNDVPVDELALHAMEGERAIVVVTAGTPPQAITDQVVMMRNSHRFEVRQGDKQTPGFVSREVRAKTDQDGKVVLYGPPSEVEISMHRPPWIAKEKVDLQRGRATLIPLHRDIDRRRSVTGKIILPPEAESSLSDASVLAGAVDGQSGETVRTLTDASGKFNFRTPASQFGVYVVTADRKWAGSVVSREHDQLLEVHLKATVDYEGRLLSPTGDPLRDHEVKMLTIIEGETHYDGNFVTQFDAPLGTTRTGSDGSYFLTGLPTEMKVIVRARPRGSDAAWSKAAELELAASE